jgi:glycosyltransferase involved in cell wall biosynthesis
VRLSVVLPCFNESANVESTVADVVGWFAAKGIDGEIVAVDDGSTDATGSILRRLTLTHPRLRLVEHPHNLGYGAAVRSGCDAARRPWIGFMDSDGQFRAADFDHLVACTSSFGFVAGRRARRADPVVRTMNTLLYVTLLRLVLRVRVRDPNCAMKLFSREVWSRVRPRHGLGALFNGEMFARLQRGGVPWTQVAVRHYPRIHGRQTGADPAVVLRMFRELIALRRALADEER